ncbi:MAG: Rrf2 family transcriptional regulator [Candidatus Aminicenantes bacterium]|nr:Rrf2 family transcriptional regulator [Candidatus Aminicenantes bacterium]
MNITRKTAYSLRALYEIVITGKGSPINRKIISERQKLSMHFLERLLKDLANAGITRSIKGPGGGFVLNKPADRITVWDVYCAVEDKSHFYNKCAFFNTKDCDLFLECQVKHIWPKINKAVKESMTDISLKDVCQKTIDQGEKNEKESRN